MRPGLPCTTVAVPDHTTRSPRSTSTPSRTVPGASASSGGGEAAKPVLPRSSNVSGPTGAPSHSKRHTRSTEDRSALERRAGRNLTPVPEPPRNSSGSAGGRFDNRGRGLGDGRGGFEGGGG